MKKLNLKAKLKLSFWSFFFLFLFLFFISFVVLEFTAATSIEVHLVPHSHCDVGYRETVDGYWRDRVSYTLSTVVEALLLNPNRTFVWEEAIWLSLLWQDGNSTLQAQFLSLLNSGQIEIIGGGWSMHDEATTSLYSTLSQMTTGLDFLINTFGPSLRPQYDWHIDPFGHSVLTPFLYASLGYSAFILDRIPNDDKQRRKLSKTLEFVWNGQNDDLRSPLFQSSSILGHVMDSQYSTPVLNGSSIDAQGDNFIQIIQARAQWFNSSILLIPFGGDFQFTNATTEFAAMDPILDYINLKSSNISIKYSTLGRYFEALNAVSDLEFPLVLGKDFFPYIACNPCNAPECSDFAVNHVPCGSVDAYWSGYFTSHPAQKLLSYQHDYFLRAAEELTSLSWFMNGSGLPSADEKNSMLLPTLESARNISGIMQHHDAITGTSFNYCTISNDSCDCFDDYNAKLNFSMGLLDELIVQCKSSLLKGHPPIVSASETDDILRQLNSSNVVGIVIFNPLAWERNELFAFDLPLCSTGENCTDYMIIDGSGLTIESQVVNDALQLERKIYFPIQVDALGINTYFLKLRVNSANPNSWAEHSHKELSSFSLSNGDINLSFDSIGRLNFLSSVALNLSLNLTEDFVHYPERLPDDTNIFTGGNVYDFVPSNTPASLWSMNLSTPAIITASGPFVFQVSVPVTPYCVRTFRLFNSSLAQNPNLYAGMLAFDVQSKIGPLPDSLPFGTLSFRLVSAFNLENTFTTTSNMFQHVERQYNDSNFVQGNVYPVVGGLFSELEGGSFRLGLIPSRPVGGYVNASFLEILTHRLLLDSDLRGKDYTTINDPMKIVLGTSNQFPTLFARHSILQFSPHLAHVGLGTSIDDWVASYSLVLSPMPIPLPYDGHLLGMRPRQNASVGLWLQGLPSAKEFYLDVSTLFPSLEALNSTWSETSADFNLAMNTAQANRLRWAWYVDHQTDSHHPLREEEDDDHGHEHEQENANKDNSGDRKNKENCTGLLKGSIPMKLLPTSFRSVRLDLAP